MIDKFNFYDVYGYFLPGAAMVLLFWLPFGLVRNSWPGSDLASAFIGVALAYFVGHLLQMFCTKVLPSTITSEVDGRGRFPSAMVIDKDSANLPMDFKTKLAEQVKKRFGLDLGIDKPSEEVDKIRNAAFFQARHVLMQAKEFSYGEQFEGLYALLRALCAAFALACAHYTGWSASVFHPQWADCAIIVAILVSLLICANCSALLLRRDLGKKAVMLFERMSAGTLLVIAFGIGYAMGVSCRISPIKAAELAACAIGALIASLRSFAAYKAQCINFALTVWRDFSTLASKADPPAGGNLQV